MFDHAGNLTSVTNKNSGGTTLSSFSYTLDNDNRKTAVSEADGSAVSFGYDWGGRLTSETRTGTNAFSVSYTLDPVGNRTSQTIGLWDDTGVTTLSTKGIGSASNLLNSQCAVGYTVMTVIGTAIQFSIQLVFTKPAFAGVKSIYLEAIEPNTNSGFVYLGTWTVQ